MKRLAAWLGLVAVACIVCLWRLPASVLLAALPAQATKHVQVHRISGTVWQGEALASLTGVVPALPLTWSCRPAFAPVGVVCHTDGAVTADLHMGIVDGALTGQRAQASLPVLANVPGGTVAATPLLLDIKSLQASGTVLALTGSARALDASLRVGTAATALGEVTLDCLPAPASAAGNASTSRCTLGNRGGTARLEGQITLSATTASGSVEFTPSGGVRQSIRF